MKISAEQVEAFARISHDRNPLHTDTEYARTTQFGHRVVYGVCSVLLGLGSWAKGRCFRLKSLRGQFGKPLFEDEEYECRIHEENGQVKVRFLKGTVVQSMFSFSWVASQHSADRSEPVTRFEPLSAANDPEVQSTLGCWQNRTYHYALNGDEAERSLSALGLHAGQMPWDQLNALVGSSYLIGMELPGRQALYSAFQFEFEKVPTARTYVCFENVHANFDTRLNRVSISGRGDGLSSFSLTAFQRPRPVRFSIEDVQERLGPSDSLHGKTVFITGATRGFGAVLAKTAALRGGQVILNYRADRAAADRLEEEIRRVSPLVTTYGGDVSDAADCAAIAAAVKARGVTLDVLIANAFPLIGARSFLEQDSAQFMEFLNKSVATTVSVLREAIPLVNKGGAVVLVSTIFTVEPKPQFAHYVAAKSALEGLMRVLALEFPGLRFIIARAPRMLTDQTNLAFDLSPPCSPIDVSARLLRTLDAATDGNLLETDLSDESKERARTTF